MRPHVVRLVVVFVVCVLTLTLCLSPAATSNAVPVIHLSSIHGYSAEISDYHADGQQNFCFTLTNTSPLPINAIGGDLGGKVFVSMSHPIFLLENQLEDHTLNGIPMSFVLFSFSGLLPGASTTICIGGLDGPADQIAHNLFVTFRPEVTLGCFSASEDLDEVLVLFTRSRPDEQCVIISNASAQPVTGVGLDLIDPSGSFDIFALTPARQPSKQHLRLSTKSSPVPGFDALIDLALMSGGQFSHGALKTGVQAGEVSSEFCIQGNFQGLTTEEIIARTYVRVGNETRQCIDVCCPVGKGQTGVLAGEPR